MKSFPKLISALFAALFLAGCGESGNPENVLVVGMELSYPPFEMKNEAGEAQGVSVDLAKALGAHLGQEVRIEDYAWVGLIPALQSNRIDCVISSMTITEERDKTIDFTDPYVKTGICLLVQKDGALQRIDDLKALGAEARVSCKGGTTGHEYAQNHLPGAKLVVLEDAATCALEVAQGKVDAFVYDQVSILQFWKKNPETTRALLEPIREEVWGIGVQQGNAKLQVQINAFLEEYRSDGGFDQLGDKWLKEWKMSFEEMGVSFVF